MALPVPNLDDRRFQDLVDEAKRLVQQRCPEWTDHNVSDPGVTLIELFAWMTDQVVYRLNRVPDRNYVKFLELIGVSLYPPTAARTQVTFWLRRPRRTSSRSRPARRSPRSGRIRPRRSRSPRPTTCRSSRAPSARLGSMIDGKTLRDHGESLEKGAGDLRASTRSRSPATRSTSASPRPCRPTRFDCASRHRSRAWAWIRPTRRWPGRPGRATTGSPASWTRTPRAASTATGTSSCTSRAGTSRR